MQIREHVGARTSPPSSCTRPARSSPSTSWRRAPTDWRTTSGGPACVEGDAVAILMENNEHIHAVMWAARRSGLYYVPINTHLTAAEAAYIVENSDAKAIIGSAALRKVCEGLGRAPAERAARPVDDRRRRSGRLAALPRMRCRPTRYADRRRDRGRSAAVLVGYHRSAEGNQARTAARAAGRGARHDVGAGRRSGWTPTRST